MSDVNKTDALERANAPPDTELVIPENLPPIKVMNPGLYKNLCEQVTSLILLMLSACYFKNAGAKGFVPSLKDIKVIDTTGAGDIFGSSALWKILETNKNVSELGEKELYDIVRFACTSAGLSTTKAGGISSVPEMGEVSEKLDG